MAVLTIQKTWLTGTNLWSISPLCHRTLRIKSRLQGKSDEKWRRRVGWQLWKILEVEQKFRLVNRWKHRRTDGRTDGRTVTHTHTHTHSNLRTDPSACIVTWNHGFKYGHAVWKALNRLTRQSFGNWQHRDTSYEWPSRFYYFLIKNGKKINGYWWINMQVNTAFPNSNIGVAERRLSVQPTSIMKAQSRNFFKDVSAMFDNPSILLLWLHNKQTFHMFSLRDLRFVFCSL